MGNREYVAENIDSAFFSEVFGTAVTVGEPSRIGSGQVGMNLRFAAHSSDPRVPRSIVVKLASPDETSRATGMALRNYEREVKFYNSIQPTVDIRVPGCYFADWNEETGFFVLVMEDMSPAARLQRPRSPSTNWRSCTDRVGVTSPFSGTTGWSGARPRPTVSDCTDWST